MENKIKTILVDDEQNAIDVFRELLSNLPEIGVVATANSVDEAVNQIIEHKPELVFLDVEMPEKNGFELLHEIRDLKTRPTIIFVTAYHQYAIDALRHAAFDYLLKPVSSVDLKKAVERYKGKRYNQIKDEKIEQLMQHINPGKLSFNTRTGTIFIQAKDIFYVQADGNYSRFVLVDGSENLVTMNLSSVFEMLNKDEFIRAGRSVILNLDYLLLTDRKQGFCELGEAGCKVRVSVPGRKLKEVERAWKRR